MVGMKDLPPAEFLRECFTYDVNTGELRWKIRPLTHFVSRRIWRAWNSRYAGSLALNTNHSGGYLEGRLTYDGTKQNVLAHRVIWKMVTGEDPEYEIDHKDLDGRNNSWDNLRSATGSNNQHNKAVQANNSTGFKGVSTHPLSPKFRARITVNGNGIHLGMFNTREEAHRARQEAALEYHGEFARHA